jgi:plastocyanin
MDVAPLVRDNEARRRGRVMLAAASSKFPYYIAGGLLAVWAVLLAAWGISHHGFPRSPGRARLVMLVSLVLVVATMATAVLTGSEASGSHPGETTPAPAATSRNLALAADPGGALRFDKTRAAVRAGHVTVTLTNDSPVGHNVTIAQGSKTLGATKTITKSTATIALNLPAGDYVFFCSVPGHRQAGMQGTLTVQ